MQCNDRKYAFSACSTHESSFLILTAENCIRASPSEDYTNGFFVALFVRKNIKMDDEATLCRDSFEGTKRKLKSEDLENITSTKSTGKIKDMVSLPRTNKFESDIADVPLKKKRRKGTEGIRN